MNIVTYQKDLLSEDSGKELDDYIDELDDDVYTSEGSIYGDSGSDKISTEMIMIAIT